MTATIIGTGHYVPSNCVSNEFMSSIVETSNEWIESRTGILNRHITSGEGTSIMAGKAAVKAIQNADIRPDEIDYIIVATMSPDNHLPNTACEVQKIIGAERAICFDINVACSGFVYGLNIADGLLQINDKKNALVIGAESVSRLIDWSDRSTCVLFGDGAGAALLQKSERGFIKTLLGSEGNRGDCLTCNTSPLQNPFTYEVSSDSYIKMNGQEVFRFAVKTVADSIKSILEETKVPKENIKYYVLHQANRRIVEGVAKRLEEPMSKFPMNLQEYGNTSAASIPILLDELNQSGQLCLGDKIILSGFGGGLTWGTVMMEW